MVSQKSAAATVAKPATEAEPKTAAKVDLYELAAADQGGYTLIPAGKVKGNATVKAVEPRVEQDGMVVCKRL